MKVRAVFFRGLMVLPLLGGMAFAQAQIATGIECSGCVGRDDIATGAVTSAKIGLAAVTTAKVGPGAVTTAKIRNAAVTLDKLAPEVQSRLLNGAITADQLSADVQARLLSGAITVDQLAPEVQARLLNGAITIDQLSPEVQSRLVPSPSTGAYEATSVAVDCNGTGTPLTDALSALNPAAAVYDVTISGTCAESLELFNFQSLRLRSADPANPATIGRVLVQSGSTYVELSSIKVQTLGEGIPTSMGAPVIANYGTGRLQLQNVEIVCTPLVDGGNCEDVVVVNSGDGRLNGMSFTGPWLADSAGRKGAVAVNRGANALIQPLPPQTCTDVKSIFVNNMATAQVADGQGCEGGLLRAYNGGTIVFSGGTVDVEVGQATIMANSSAGNGAWFRSLSCGGALAAVVDQYGGNTDYCP